MEIKTVVWMFGNDHQSKMKQLLNKSNLTLNKAGKNVKWKELECPQATKTKVQWQSSNEIVHWTKVPETLTSVMRQTNPYRDTRAISWETHRICSKNNMVSKIRELIDRVYDVINIKTFIYYLKLIFKY